MKIINDLVVVEVPKGAKQFEYFDKETLPPAIVVHLESDENGMPNLYPIQLPFPCTIIGLASEMDGKDAIQMLQMHGIILPADYEPIPALHGQIKRIYGMEITDTTDLLFLKRI